MSDFPATRTKTASSGIDLKTLWITAVSSAAAAYACSKVWTPGTLAAAAFTPVLVAIIREGLAKSTDVVTRVVPVKGVVRSATPEGPRPLEADPPTAAWSAADLGAEPPVSSGDPASRIAQPGEIAYHGVGRRARHWRIAIVTGLLGFLIAAVVFTVPELVAGGSAAGGGRGTTIFGGKQHSSRTPAVTTTTTTAPAKTATAPAQSTVTVPRQTVTTPPPAVTTPQPDPAATTPVPTTTTAPPPVAEPAPSEVPLG